MSTLWSPYFLSGLSVADVVVIDFTFLEVAEWNPHLDMWISYYPVVEFRRAISRMQGMTYRPRCLFVARLSLAKGNVCYLTHHIFVLTTR